MPDVLPSTVKKTHWQDITIILANITYKDDYKIVFTPAPIQKLLGEQVRSFTVWITFPRKDAVTGEMGTGYSGQIVVDETMTKSQIVRKLFGMCLALEEHECREFFKFANKAVFGPHIDVMALREIAEQYD